MNESKQTNFRVNEDAANRFREFCTQEGMSQAQGFDHIMQILEMNQAKIVTPGRAAEIERFEAAVKNINEAYLHSIEICNTAEQRSLDKYAGELERKERTISTFQDKVAQLEEKLKTAKEATNAAEAAKAKAEEKEKNATAQMEAAKKTADDKEHISAMLSMQLEEATNKLAGYEELKDSETALRAEVDRLTNQLQKAVQELEYTKDLYSARLKEAETFEAKYSQLEVTVTAMKEQLTEKDMELAKQHAAAQSELEKAQMQATLDMERALMAKEREVQVQIRDLDKEIARLTAYAEQLQGKIDQNPETK